METATIILSLPEENQALKEQVRHFKEQIDELTIVIQRRDSTISAQQRQLNELIQRIYGRKSEKLHPDQLLLENFLLEADKNQPAPAEPVEVVKEQKVKEHTRVHRGRTPLPEHLKRVDHYLDVAAEERKCKSCAKELKHIGDDITERLDYSPSSLLVNRYIRPKYACGDCQCDGCGVKQHGPARGPIDKCEADSGLLAHVIEEKYEHHTPLYRQELKFNRQGMDLSRQTMADWMAGCAGALKPLYERMHEEVLKHDIVLNDDTPVEMQEKGLGTTRTSRLWCTVGGENLKYTLYNFTLGRGREGPLEFFKDYQGNFLSDAYGGYNELLKSPTIRHVGCWAHARRYFVKA